MQTQEKGTQQSLSSSPPSQSLELRRSIKLLSSRAEDLIIRASTSHKLKPWHDFALPNMKRTSTSRRCIHNW